MSEATAEVSENEIANAVMDLRDTMLGCDPYTIPLDEIDVAQPALFQADAFWPFFDRLRKEEPVHYCRDSQFGPFWSVTKFNDIMEVEANPQLFSSADGISIAPVNTASLPVEMFIAMDEPKHGEQRKTVQDVVAPKNLAELEPLIRERVGRILDSLPVGETFNWVDRVSIELTCLATRTGLRMGSFTTNVVNRSRSVTAASDGMSVNGSMNGLPSRNSRVPSALYG